MAILHLGLPQVKYKYEMFTSLLFFRYRANHHGLLKRAARVHIPFIQMTLKYIAMAEREPMRAEKWVTSAKKKMLFHFRKL